jgi:hypothetical protein
MAHLVKHGRLTTPPPRYLPGIKEYKLSRSKRTFETTQQFWRSNYWFEKTEEVASQVAARRCKPIHTQIKNQGEGVRSKTEIGKVGWRVLPNVSQGILLRY